MASSTRHQEVRQALIVTLVANLLVAVAKIIIGALTRSLAMVSDGIHSSLDATSNVIGLISTVIAAQPPDEEHPYGHRRFETLASLMIGGILLLTAWEIGKSSINRLASGNVPEVGPINFIVMVGTIIVNLLVWRYEKGIGDQHNAEILLADAEHTRSDIYVSLTVLASLAAVWLGWGWLDAVAALGVVVLILLAAGRIVLRSSSVLVDRAPLESDAVSDVVANVAGVREVVRVRSRGPADDIHLDVDVRVAGPTTAEHSASLAREVRSQLRAQFEGLKDIQVTFMPESDAAPDHALIARAEGDALGLGVHEVIPSSSHNGLSLDMHVEVPPEQTVGEAHKLVTEFERRLHEKVDDLVRIVTHIEPAHTHENAPLYEDEAHRLARQTMQIANELYPENEWHDLEIRAETDGGYAISLHCHVDYDMLLEEAHRMAEVVETQVRAEHPAIHRVTIHTEPPGE